VARLHDRPRHLNAATQPQDLTAGTRPQCLGTATGPRISRPCSSSTGTGLQVLACLRNLVIGVLSRAGPVNLAAALRHHARDPTRSLATLGITSDATDST
jgi:hypothetical protein